MGEELDVSARPNKTEFTASSGSQASAKGQLIFVCHFSVESQETLCYRSEE